YSRMSCWARRTCSTSCHADQGRPSGRSPRSAEGNLSTAASKPACAESHSRSRASNFRRAPSGVSAERVILSRTGAAGPRAATFRRRARRARRARLRPLQRLRPRLHERVEEDRVRVVRHLVQLTLHAFDRGLADLAGLEQALAAGEQELGPVLDELRAL